MKNTDIWVDLGDDIIDEKIDGVVYSPMMRKHLRNDEEDLPILHFATKGQTLGQYLKCQILSNYATYGGLHYFGLYTGDLLHV